MRISTKCSIAVHCLLFLHEYGETQKVTSGLLALSTGCNPVMIRNIMSGLRKAGMVELAPGQSGTHLSCPIQEITLYRICMAVEPGFLDDLIGLHPLPSPLCPVGQSIHTVLDTSYHKLREDMRISLQSITLAEIAEDYHRYSAEQENAHEKCFHRNQ